MLVKSTHFIPSVPGMPVYELMDGTIMLPYIQKGMYIYASFEDFVKNGASKEDIIKYRKFYDNARRQINSVSDTIMQKVVN